MPGFQTICDVSADLSKVARKIEMEGKGCVYEAKFQIGLTFGETELKAAVYWTENVSLLAPFTATSSSVMFMKSGFLGRCEARAGHCDTVFSYVATGGTSIIRYVYRDRGFV